MIKLTVAELNKLIGALLEEVTLKFDQAFAVEVLLLAPV